MLSKFDLEVFFTNYCAVMTLSEGEKLRQKLRESYGLENYTVDHNCAACSHHKISSEDTFFAYRFLSSQHLQDFLPKYDKQLLLTLSHHFINVYTALWSSPNTTLVEAGNHFISKYLKNDFNYTTVHKRSLEGACNGVLSQNIKLSDFSPLDIPMGNKEWTGNLKKAHPLCVMTADFVNETLHLQNKQNDPLFISFDGRGDVSGLVKYGAIFSSVLEINEADGFAERKFLDMFIAMHGDFFILNPYSTYSWQIFVIRTVLGLKSVPILNNKDFYLRNSVESNNMTDHEGLWVSWSTIITESENMRIGLKEET